MKRILLVYGILSFFYKIFITFVMLVFFYRIVNFFFPENSVFIYPFVAFRLLKKRLRAPLNGIKFLYQDKKEMLKKPRWAAVVILIIAITIGLFVFLPLPRWHSSTFVVEPIETVSARAGTGGFVDKILIKEGEEVRRGTRLAILQDRNLEEQRNSLQSQIDVLDRNIRAHSALGSVAESRVEETRRTQLSQQLVNTETQLSRLIITAPQDGIVVTPKVEQKIGIMLKEGDEFCSIAKAGSVQARIRVDDWDLEDVAVGAAAKLWLNAAQGRTIKGRVSSVALTSELHQRLAPAAKQNTTQNGASGEVKQVKVSAGRPATAKKRSAREEAEALADEATSPFEAPLTRFDAMIEFGSDPTIKPGMSGTAKVYGPSRPLAVIVWRSVRDWFRVRVWW